MRVAIASGKGGTGKTTVAVNLAWVAGALDQKVRLLDCDVEAPNCHLFLHPKVSSQQDCKVTVPVIDKMLCDLCGRCAKVCRFRALVSLPGEILLEPTLCHNCGACKLVCPKLAITVKGRAIGIIEDGLAGTVRFRRGLLAVGEAKSPPLIKRVKADMPENILTIIDCPPGTACPAYEAVKGSDYALLVAEPTSFGLHDLAMATAMVKAAEVPFGVVVNRHEEDNDLIRNYCNNNTIPLLAEIPDTRAFAEMISKGWILAQCRSDIRDLYLALFKRLRDVCAEAKP
ncbi:MAG: ATP-binding protein [Fibrobacterota bacterium]